MSGGIARAAFFVASFAVAGTAVAAGGGDDHGSALTDFIWQIVNFVLLVGVLIYLVRKPIQKFFGDRREQIRGDLDDAGDLLKQAEARYAEWQRKLAELDTEIADIRDTARSRAREEGERILADARATADRIKQDAAAAVDQEILRARTELRDEASDLAVQLAADLLREQVGDADRDRLIDDFIARVEETRN